MRVLHTILLLALATTVLPAQKGKDYKTKVNEKVMAMRKAMRDGKVVHYNVRVRVRLKNGNRLKGIVKNGRLVELVDGLDFVTSANQLDPRAGLRVWYTAGTNSFIFVSYKDIARYKIGSTLSDEQVKAIEMKIADAKREMIENYERLQDAKKNAADKNKTAQNQQQPPGNQGQTGAEPELQLTAEQKKLLEEFPPSAGWSENKLNKLKLERITIGRFPNEKERKFEGSFTAWNEAYKKSQEIANAKKQAARRGKPNVKTSGNQPPTTGGTGARTPGGTPQPYPVKNSPPMPGPKK